MLDNKGSFYIVDAILAIVLVLIVFSVVNTAISIPAHDYSYEIKDIKNAQDIMELLSGKIDFNDNAFLKEISDILNEGENSKESVRKVSEITKNKLNSYDLKNYMLTENNVLKGEVLASKGDYKKSNNVNAATRIYGEYSYTLLVW